MFRTPLLNTALMTLNKCQINIYSTHLFIYLIFFQRESNFKDKKEKQRSSKDFNVKDE